jgi:hypothetical protein
LIKLKRGHNKRKASLCHSAAAAVEPAHDERTKNFMSSRDNGAADERTQHTTADFVQ